MFVKYKCPVVTGAATLAFLLAAGAQAAPASLPGPVPKPAISGIVPLRVPLPTLPPDVTPVSIRPYFDVFSWQTFIALNWPAKAGVRGVPNQPTTPSVFLKASNTTPLVWGSYKEAYELFGTGNKTPTPWQSFDVPVNPCSNATPPGMKLLTKVTKPDNLVDEVNQAFSYPLIDQNKNYVYAEVRFNQAYYDYVLNTDGGLYLLKNLAKAQPVSMPAAVASPPKPGAMMLKASWRQLIQGKDDFSRYYVVDAQVYNPDSKACSAQTMGLVGFHIGYKLADFPEWVWSTFEQVDNVQRGHGATPTTPISFNNGTDNPKTAGGYANRPSAAAPPLQPMDQRVPAQITRYNPIPDTPVGASTVDLNNTYQAALKGTVWEFYELVTTQWPFNAGQFKLAEDGGVYPQDAGGAFPPNGVVNTSMESFVQAQEDAAGAGGNSCMSCHYRASQSDFSWALQGRAH